MAISPSSGQPIAFLDPRNQPRSPDPMRADDALRARQEIDGPESARALNRRDAEIAAQRLLTGRQIDRAERNRQFDIAQLDARREAEANLQNAVFDPSAPRGSVVDIQA